MRKEPSRLILVRHLDTKARQIRTNLKEDPDNKVLLGIFHQPQLSDTDKKELFRLGNVLFERYGRLVSDASLSILDSENKTGLALGQAIIEKFGIPKRWEVSPFVRARQSSQLMRKGIMALGLRVKLPREKINKRVSEKNYGDASEYPSKQIYLATHPKELEKYLDNPDDYPYPHGDSKRKFRRRVGRQVFLEKWAPRYRKGDTVLVAHSLVIEEHLRRHIGYAGGNDDIWTGTVTVLEAKPSRFWQQRRYTLVGRVGQHIADVKERQSAS